MPFYSAPKSTNHKKTKLAKLIPCQCATRRKTRLTTRDLWANIPFLHLQKVYYTAVFKQIVSPEKRAQFQKWLVKTNSESDLRSRIHPRLPLWIFYLAGDTIQELSSRRQLHHHEEVGRVLRVELADGDHVRVIQLPQYVYLFVCLFVLVSVKKCVFFVCLFVWLFGC